MTTTNKYIQNLNRSRIVQLLNENLNKRYGVPIKLLIDLTSKTLTIEEFADTHLTALNLSKQQTYNVVAALTGYSAGTVANWCSQQCKATTPVSVQRILGIIHVVITLFKNYNIKITRKTTI
jgi:F420-0:gamma-glutamyl ligase-like protein